MSDCVVVRFDMEVIVEFENDVSTEEGGITETARERAIKAAISAMTNTEVYIDGEDNEPAKVTFDASDSDVIDVYF